MKKCIFSLLLILPFLFASCDGEETIICEAKPIKGSLIELKTTIASIGVGVRSSVTVNVKGTVKVDWGDGNITDHAGTVSEQEITHTYQQVGTYAIKMTAEEGALTHFATDGHLGLYDEIKLTQTQDLKTLGIVSDTKIKSLDLSGDFPNLQEIILSECSNLASLNVTGCPKLEKLSCDETKLESLDVSKNPLLKTFSCFSGLLTKLDVTKNENLEKLTCSRNALESLDISKNTKLVNLWCDYNKLKTLDVSNLLVLQYLSCSRNEMTNIDLTKNAALEIVNASYNKFTDIKLDDNNSLNKVEIYNNSLAEEALNDIFNKLPNSPGRIFCANNPGLSTADTNILKGKGWILDMWVDEE